MSDQQKDLKDVIKRVRIAHDRISLELNHLIGLDDARTVLSTIYDQLRVILVEAGELPDDLTGP